MRKKILLTTTIFIFQLCAIFGQQTIKTERADVTEKHEKELKEKLNDYEIVNIDLNQLNSYLNQSNGISNVSFGLKESIATEMSIYAKDIRSSDYIAVFLERLFLPTEVRTLILLGEVLQKMGKFD